jgi:hypothetical protein
MHCTPGFMEYLTLKLKTITKQHERDEVMSTELTNDEAHELINIEPFIPKIVICNSIDKLIRSFEYKTPEYRGTGSVTFVGYSEVLKKNVAVFVDRSGYQYNRYKTRPIDIFDIRKFTIHELLDSLKFGSKSNLDGNFDLLKKG